MRRYASQPKKLPISPTNTESWIALIKISEVSAHIASFLAARQRIEEELPELKRVRVGFDFELWDMSEGEYRHTVLPRCPST